MAFTTAGASDVPACRGLGAERVARSGECVVDLGGGTCPRAHRMSISVPVRRGPSGPSNRTASITICTAWPGILRDERRRAAVGSRSPSVIDPPTLEIPCQCRARRHHRRPGADAPDPCSAPEKWRNRDSVSRSAASPPRSRANFVHGKSDRNNPRRRRRRERGAPRRVASSAVPPTQRLGRPPPPRTRARRPGALRIPRAARSESACLLEMLIPQARRRAWSATPGEAFVSLAVRARSGHGGHPPVRLDAHEPALPAERRGLHVHRQADTDQLPTRAARRLRAP